MASSLALKSSAALRSFSAVSTTKTTPAAVTNVALPKFVGFQGGAKHVELVQGASKSFGEVAVAQMGGKRSCSCAAQMVAATAAEPAVTKTYDFDTKIFKKERINLAGHEEVMLHGLAMLPLTIDSLLQRVSASSFMTSLQWKLRFDAVLVLQSSIRITWLLSQMVMVWQ